MARGRPVKSQVRQNIIEILHFLGKGYAYDIYKIYREIYAPVTIRSIYYHLKKGVSINEFRVSEIKNESGEYSWGTQAEKIYYALGPSASPIIDSKVKEYFDRR
ncbi:MAG: hypothetical protein KJ574_04235 [Nanoarchaeota archaeon]|nr:hypothetical protein [Nanoarchaeota archaeon]